MDKPPLPHFIVTTSVGGKTRYLAHDDAILYVSAGLRVGIQKFGTTVIDTVFDSDSGVLYSLQKVETGYRV